MKKAIYYHGWLRKNAIELKTAQSERIAIAKERGAFKGKLRTSKKVKY
ncbi:hypothetical protein [Lysinibacillus fusiformis]|nr:hypothetical protein [Lysinibacillus fusiformis]